MASMGLSLSTSKASCSAGTALPTSGAAAPAWEVVNNTGSMCSKSPSARMRSMSTEPTMPRQPINPTRIITAIL